MECAPTSVVAVFTGGKEEGPKHWEGDTGLARPGRSLHCAAQERKPDRASEVVEGRDLRPVAR